MSQAFSIRDYAFKMRSQDVFQCWPFPAADLTADQVRSLLPPITLPSFRSWSDELTKLRSERAAAAGQQNPPQAQLDEFSIELPVESEKSEELERYEEEKSENPPAELVVSLLDDGEVEPEEKEEEKLESEEVEEKSENLPAEVVVASLHEDGEVDSEKEKLEPEEELATLTAVNAEIDGCLGRPKLKSPEKKRSVAEVFEVEEKDEVEEQQEEEENPPEEQQRSERETAMKFWPFGEDISVTVAKFQWLSRRLEALKSSNKGAIGRKSERSDGGGSNSMSTEEGEEKSEMVCPVCRVFTAATVTAANSHIDSCLAHAMREERLQMKKKMCPNLKPKPPKKRSIAEILNEAPQVEGGTSDAAAEGAGEEEDNGERVAIKSKKNKNKKKKVVKKKCKVGKRLGVVLLNDESMKIRRKKMKAKTKKKKEKMKKKKKNLLNHDLAGKFKEDAHKNKMQNSAIRFRKLKGFGNEKTVKLDDIGASCSHEKKLDFKILSEEEENKEQVKNYDSVNGKQQEEAVEATEEESHCDVELVPSSGNMHVRFSGKDDVLCSKDRDSFDETASLAKEQSSGSDEAIANLESNRDDDGGDNTAISIDKRKGVCPTNYAMDQVEVQNFLKPCSNNNQEEYSKHSIEKGESSLFEVAAFCDKFDKGKTTNPVRPLSVLQAGQISGLNTQVCESSGAVISTRKFIDRLEDSSVQSATKDSNANSNTRTFLEPSNSNERPNFGLHTYGYGDNDNNGNGLRDGPSSYMFSSDMIGNPSLFAGQGKGSVRDNNRVDRNFVGLPLNSHGELINFSSSSAPVNDSPQPNREEHLSLNERHVAKKTLQDGAKPFPHYPARLGVTTELQGRDHHLSSDRRSDHFVWPPVDPALNHSRSSPFVEKNWCDRTPNRQEIGMASAKESSDLILPRPTMRLMGKDVLIGGSSSIEKQQSERGHVWTGEESRRRQHYFEDAAAIDNNSILGRRGSKQNLGSSGSQFLQAPTENHVLQQSLKTQSNHPSMMKGNLGVNNNNNASSNLHQAPTYNTRPDNLQQWQSVSGAKSQALISFQSQVLPTPHPTNPSSQGEHDNNNNNERKNHHHHYVTSSPFGLENAKTPLSQRSSSRSFPPWLLSSNNHEFNSFAPPQSVNHSAEFQHHHNKNPLVPPSNVVQQPPYVPVTLTPLSKQASGMYSGFRNMNEVVTNNTSRKRPAPPDFIDLTKPNKLHNLGFDSQNHVDQDNNTRSRVHSSSIPIREAAADCDRDLELQRRLANMHRF